MSRETAQNRNTDTPTSGIRVDPSAFQNFDALDVGVLILNGDLSIRFMNRWFLQRLTADRRSALHLNDLYEDSIPDQIVTRLEAAFKYRSIQFLSTAFHLFIVPLPQKHMTDGMMRQSGLMIPVLLQNPNNKNSDVGVLIQINDISNLTQQVKNLIALNREKDNEIKKRRQAETKLHLAKEEAEKANKMKSRLLAVAGHDIRIPLNTILGYCQLLSRKARTDHTLDSIGDELQSMLTCGHNLIELLENILDFDKIESGKIENDPIGFNVPELIEELSAVFQFSASEKSIRFEYFLSENVPVNVFSDRNKIKQILMNLLNNAFTFTPDGKSITLRIMFEGDRFLVFTVVDEGEGIPRESFRSIFHPFVTASKGIKEPKSSKGLGLFIVKQLVESLNGEISLISEPDQGSNFTVMVPVQPISKVNPGNVFILEELDFSEIRDKLIMIVEDNPLNIDLFRAWFSATDVQTVYAENGLEAVDLARSKNPDLILMDIFLPGIDGFEAARRIHELPRLENVPIIAVSADIVEIREQNEKNKEIVDFISKPISFDRLFEKVFYFLSEEGSN